MIKAVATALVLIAGAAVVLWFGNTLNSWILGGLIGGLAALLLSIPISLTLFSYLSRHHDERLRAEAEWTEAELAEMYEYEEIPARTVRGAYEVEEYVEDEDEEFWDEEENEEYYQQPRKQMRNLPQPVPQRLLEQSPSSNRMPASQRGNYAPLPKPGTRNMPATRGKETGSRRATSRQLNYPGFPGYEPGTVLRHHRSAALRAARREKLQQYEDDVEVLPTHFSRRVPSMRPERDLIDDYEQLPRTRSSRQLPPETPQPQRRPRVVESRPSRSELPRSLPSEGGSSLSQSAYLNDPETENLGNYSPETGPMRRPTGQFARNPHIPQTENPSGSLGRPLVRRAPYTYEDDPIRQELSQQLYPPRVRRSSRLEPQQYDQE
ncbi:MAG: hypothetical protein JO215_03925 [Ktedonobacteraceae bacterium]|nr:hypothetical protein [Ktedonobacteraceae bacterium]